MDDLNASEFLLMASFVLGAIVLVGGLVTAPFKFNGSRRVRSFAIAAGLAGVGIPVFVLICVVLTTGS